ncbi:MAG: hypothetical protein M3M85_04440 [bacterium]|nr:hypothetical protein [bacterium]
MKLSDEAKEELVAILKKDIGSESISMLNEEEINALGDLSLHIFKEALKIRISEKEV